MRAISLDTFKDLKDHGWWSGRCLLCGAERPQFHHNLIHGGQQVDEAFAIIELCPACHYIANTPEVRQRLDWIMWNRATDEQIARYSKVIDYKKRREELNKKYGERKLHQN